MAASVQPNHNTYQRHKEEDEEECIEETRSLPYQIESIIYQISNCFC
uniref:Uncharacterized protein n=1 Tax=Kalanchoe fedtschenkoi TaxID=63787 RepID=A0A7N0UKN3_KALFE